MHCNHLVIFSETRDVLTKLCIVSEFYKVCIIHGGSRHATRGGRRGKASPAQNSIKLICALKQQAILKYLNWSDNFSKMKYKKSYLADLECKTSPLQRESFLFYKTFEKQVMRQLFGGQRLW